MLALGVVEYLLPPASFSFSAVMMLAPAGSSNAKSFCTATGTPVMSGWTYGSVTVPAVPGGAIYIQSAGVEPIALAFVP
jgi:hypothetical protein